MRIHSIHSFLIQRFMTNERKNSVASKSIECKNSFVVFFLICIFPNGYGFSQMPLANLYSDSFRSSSRIPRQSQRYPIICQGAGDGDDGNDLSISGSSSHNENKRRTMMKATITLAFTLLFDTQPSRAGLVQFPCNYELMNTYHFMRAGESLLESEDIISSNPLFL